MRVYVGEQDEIAGRCRVWVAHEEPRPEIREVVEVLGDLNRLMDLRRDGATDGDYDEFRAKAISRKNEIIEQIRKAEDVPPPVELRHRGIHSPDGFEWGYAGSGPAELAYSILRMEIGEEPTAPVYLRFRDDVVARITGPHFRLTADVVWEWIEANRQLVEVELFDKLPVPERDDLPALAITNEDLPPVDTRLNEASGSAVVRACEQAWRDIQHHHPEVPDAVIILGSGVERGRLVKLGHWWGGRWIADGQARGEVLLAGEALHLKPGQVFEVLLHEAAHGLNAARRIPDTSRGGRYHNRRFAATAGEVLLEAELMPPYGFAATKLTVAAEERYAPTIERLGEAMRIARQIAQGTKVSIETEGQLGGEREGGRERDGRRNEAVTALCGCGRRLRMAPSIFQKGPVVCGVCGTAFDDGAERAQEPEPDNAVVDRTFMDRRRAELERQNPLDDNRDEVATRLAGQRARLHAALAAAEDSNSVGLHPLWQRLDRLDRMLQSLTAQPVDPVAPTDIQLQGVRALATANVLPQEVSDLARWYETFGTLDERPMALRHGRHDASELARALLKADGTLRAPSIEFGEGDLFVGDRVVTSRDMPSFDLPSGVPGTVRGIDARSRTVDVDFATWGRVKLSPADMVDAGVQHDYVTADLAAVLPDDLAGSIAVEASRIDPGLAW